MNVFCLKQGQEFEVLGGTIVLEFPLSAPLPPPAGVVINVNSM